MKAHRSDIEINVPYSPGPGSARTNARARSFAWWTQSIAIVALIGAVGFAIGYNVAPGAQPVAPAPAPARATAVRPAATWMSPRAQAQVYEMMSTVDPPAISVTKVEAPVSCLHCGDCVEQQTHCPAGSYCKGNGSCHGFPDFAAFDPQARCCENPDHTPGAAPAPSPNNEPVHSRCRKANAACAAIVHKADRWCQDHVWDGQCAQGCVAPKARAACSGNDGGGSAQTTAPPTAAPTTAATAPPTTAATAPPTAAAPTAQPAPTAPPSACAACPVCPTMPSSPPTSSQAPSAPPSPSPSPVSQAQPSDDDYCPGAGSQPRPAGYAFDASICGNDRFHSYAWLQHYDDKIAASQCGAKTQPYSYLAYTDARGRARQGFGYCDKNSKPNAPEFGTVATDKLAVDFTKLQPGDAGMAEVGKDFDAMHKIWGAGGEAKSSGGVNKDNVFLGRRTLTDPATGQASTGTYLVLRAQGDRATSGSLAVKMGSERTGPKDYCKAYELVDGKYSRVGAVVGTKKAYASGRYKIVARVPPGNDGEVDGMGYVWAMWTFHYEEMYPRGPGGAGPSDDQLLRGQDHPAPWAKGELYQTCAPGYTGPCDSRFACGNSGDCKRNEAPFTMHVHEIDIEVPANPRTGKFKDADGKWKSDTINFNTWTGDDQDYGPDSPYHQQAAQQGSGAPGGASLISRHEAEFRTYEFVWVAGDRVEFYVDGAHVYTSRRYVPTRASRLVFGPWFGWWGGAANFDAREVLVKSVEITPVAHANDRAWPQQFDQCNPDATDRTICDFNALGTADGRRCEPDTCVRAGFKKLTDTHCTASRAAAVAALPPAPFGVPKRFG